MTNKELANEIKKEHSDRTRKHIERVKKYGKIINKDYSDHDSDKLKDKELALPYAFLNYKYKHKDFEIPNKIENMLDRATALHILRNRHHPEYWAENKDEILETFKRDKPIQNIDCTKMDNDSIDEMCCDWCAMSEEFNNSPIEWADKVVNKRWIFSDIQKEYIYNKLNKLWENK